jgi:site-specific recombinase XerD
MPHQAPKSETTTPETNPALVYLAGLAKGSQPTMQSALNTIAQFIYNEDETVTYHDIAWHKLRPQQTNEIKRQLRRRYSSATVNKSLSALRGVLKAAWALGQMTADAYQAAASVQNVKGNTLPAGRSISTAELTALLDHCGRDITGIRDAAIISTLYACGLRRSELIALDLKDYDQSAKKVSVKGKGNKERLVPLASGAAHALADWLAVRGPGSGPLFWGTGNRNQQNRLTTQAIYKMLQTRAEAAGIPVLSPHDFRHTFVSDLLDAGVDLMTVQKLAGHASVETTGRYDPGNQRSQEEATAKLLVPYRRRTLTDA